MSVRNARWARPACDPELPARLRALARQTRITSRPRRWLDAASLRARRAVITCWLLAFCCFIVGLVGGLSPVWAAAWMAATATAASTAVVLGYRLSPVRELWRSRDRVIFPHSLDTPSQVLLARAQHASEEILHSGVRAAGLLEHAADEMTLQRHEWEVACALRDISGLRAQLDQGAPAGPAGTMTAAVLDSQRHAIALARDATAARVTALERYAGQVKSADDAHGDWRNALRLAGLNDRYLDLVARTAADELAISEIQDLTERAGVTMRMLQDCLQEANLAAEILALPVARAG
jgi:hypothetical protein